jgi:hypothetical protein
MHPLIGLLILVVFALSLYQTYLITFAADPTSYSGIPAQDGLLPPDEYRGAFLQLKPGADPRFASNLVELLETDTPGVVTAEQMLTLSAESVAAVVVNQAAIDPDVNQYRVYAVGKEPQDTSAQRIASGHMLRITPNSGAWAPGSYLIDVPSGGMFDTSRVYYAFAIR